MFGTGVSQGFRNLGGWVCVVLYRWAFLEFGLVSGLTLFCVCSDYELAALLFAYDVILDNLVILAQIATLGFGISWGFREFVWLGGCFG